MSACTAHPHCRGSPATARLGVKELSAEPQYGGSIICRLERGCDRSAWEGWSGHRVRTDESHRVGWSAGPTRRELSAPLVQSSTETSVLGASSRPRYLRASWSARGAGRRGCRHEQDFLRQMVDLKSVADAKFLSEALSRGESLVMTWLLQRARRAAAAAQRPT